MQKAKMEKRVYFASHGIAGVKLSFDTLVAILCPLIFMGSVAKIEEIPNVEDKLKTDKC